MRSTKVLFFVSTLLITIPSISQKDNIQKSRLLISEFVIKNNIPGLSITVSRNDSIIWSEGFGYSNVELKEPVDPATSKFRIGSISKTFTAAALGVLLQQGNLELDAPIQKYVSSFPKKKWEVTLRQVAGHLGGIRHYKKGEFFSTQHYKTVKEGLKIFKKDKLLHQPGTKYVYSSYGWNLISVAVENITKTSFLSYMEDVVFKPLDMDQTVADYNQKIILNRTGYYTFSPDTNTLKNARYVDNSYKWAGGGFLSTTEDMVKFGNAFLKNEFLDPSTINTLWTSQKTLDGNDTDYGIGWKIYRHNDREWLGHGGGSVGGSTIFMLNKETKLVVTIVANLSQVQYGDIHFKVAENFMR